MVPIGAEPVVESNTFAFDHIVMHKAALDTQALTHFRVTSSSAGPPVAQAQELASSQFPPQASVLHPSPYNLDSTEAPLQVVQRFHPTDGSVTLAATRAHIGKVWEAAERHVQNEFQSLHTFYRRVIEERESNAMKAIVQLRAEADRREQEIEKERQLLATEREKLKQAYPVMLQRANMLAQAELVRLVHAAKEQQTSVLKTLEDEKKQSVLDLRRLTLENAELKAEKKKFAESQETKQALIDKLHDEEGLAMSIRTRLIAENKRLNEELSLATSALAKMEEILTGHIGHEGNKAECQVISEGTTTTERQSISRQINPHEKGKGVPINQIPIENTELMLRFRGLDGQVE